MDTSPENSKSERELLETAYTSLKRLAANRLKGERSNHTLQPTALVHEAYLRLSEQRTPFRDRTHFLALAARAMRRILVDHARRRGAAKRPEHGVRVTLSGLSDGDGRDLEAARVQDALQSLAKLDPRAAQIVELRALAGCTAPETAEILRVSISTVERDWRMAKSWLRREVSKP